MDSVDSSVKLGLKQLLFLFMFFYHFLECIKYTVEKLLIKEQEGEKRERERDF